MQVVGLRMLRAVEYAPTWAGVITMLCTGVVLGAVLEMEMLLSMQAFMVSVTGVLVVLSFGLISMLRGRHHRHEVVFLTIGLVALVISLAGRFASGDSDVWTGAYVVSSGMLLWYAVMVLYMHTRGKL